MTAFKTCRLCGQTKPPSDFYTERKAKDGYRTECKACNKARRKDWYAVNREREIERVKQWQRAHRDEYNARQRAWRRANRHREREGHLRRTFGITQDDYLRMFEDQGCGCGICGDPPPEGVHLHVDHDPRTGAVRGLLCVRCNQALGQFRERPALLASAIEYVEEGKPTLMAQKALARLARERAYALSRAQKASV